MLTKKFAATPTDIDTDDPEAPALNTDGSLKEAHELTFLHSPSDELKTSLVTLRLESPSPSGKETTSSSLPGLSIKGHAQLVAEKRQIAPNPRFRDSPREPSFVKAIAGNRPTVKSTPKDAGRGSTRGNQGTPHLDSATSTASGSSKKASRTTLSNAKHKSSTAADSQKHTPAHKKQCKVTADNYIVNSVTSITHHFASEHDPSKHVPSIQKNKTTSAVAVQVNNEPEEEEDDNIMTDKDSEGDDGEETEELESEEVGQAEMSADKGEGTNTSQISGRKNLFTVKPVQKHALRGQDPRTADIRVIMTLDESDGVKGWFCEVCRTHDPKLFSGNWDTYKEVYERDNQFKYWFMYFHLVFVIATLLTEVYYLNVALALFNTTMVTPTYYVIFTIFLIITTIVLFQGLKASAKEIITLVMGFLVICFSIVILQMSKLDPRQLSSLNRRSMLLLQAARAKTENFGQGEEGDEEKSVLGVKDSGMDALRGSFSAFGSIIQARSVKPMSQLSFNYQGSRATGLHHNSSLYNPYNLHNSLPHFPQSGTDSHFGGLQQHQLYDAPVPSRTPTTMNVGEVNSTSSNAGTPVMGKRPTIKFGEEDLIHQYGRQDNGTYQETCWCRNRWVGRWRRIPAVTAE